MVCSRCGAELNPKQRYCMRCGALNYDHPDNQKMKQYITDEELQDANQKYQKALNTSAETIEIGGKLYADSLAEDKKTTYVDTRVMLVLLLVITIGLGAIYYFVFPYSLTMMFSLCFLFFILCFIILTNIAIYMKGGYSGFSLFVPFYSQYAYFDIAFGNGWLFLICFIPVVGIIYSFYAIYKMGKAFGKSGWLTLFFPFIMLPIIAFSDMAIYRGTGKKYKAYVEKGKKRNTKLPSFVCCVLIFIAFFGFTQLPVASDVALYFTQKDIERARNDVSNDIRDGLYICNGQLLNAKKGEYYILVDDLSDAQRYPIPIRSSLNGEKISGYFYIVNKKSKNEPKIYSNITDGEHIFSEDDKLPSSIPKDAVVCTKES